MSESLPKTDKVQRLAVLSSIDKLASESDKSVKGHQQTTGSTVGRVTHTTSEAVVADICRQGLQVNIYSSRNKGPLVTLSEHLPGSHSEYNPLLVR